VGPLLPLSPHMACHECSGSVEWHQRRARLVRHDPLTGLGNAARLDELLADAGGRTTPAVLVMVSVEIDTELRAHDRDECTILLADRVRRSAGAESGVVRLEGTTFAVVARDLELSAGPLRLATRIRDAIRPALTLADRVVRARSSIGVAVDLYADDAAQLRLHAQAAMAMAMAEAQGGDRVVLHDDEVDAVARDRLELEARIALGFSNREFEVWYQPEVELQSGRILAVEALIRWRAPSGAIHHAGDFLAHVRQLGGLVEVGRWVLMEACRDARRWSSLGHRLAVRVNLDAEQLDDPGLVEWMRHCLEVTAVDPTLVSLEVDSGVLSSCPKARAERITALGALGLGLSVDGVGAGGLDVRALASWQLEVVKVHRSLIDAIEVDDEQRQLLRGLVLVAGSVGAHVSALGIERRSQVAAAEELGVARGQGFQLCEALPLTALHRQLEFGGLNIDGLSMRPASSTAHEPSAFELRLLVENSADATVWTSGDGRVRWISGSVEQLIGVRPTELIGARVVDWVHSDDHPILERLRRATSVRGSNATDVFRIRTSDGTWRAMSVRITSVFDEHGRFLGRVAGWRDVQSELDAQSALARSEERYRALAAAAEHRHAELVAVMREGLCEIDAAGVVTFANPSLVEMLETTSEEMVGSPALFWISVRNSEDVLGSFASTREASTFSGEVVLRRASGAEVSTFIAATPIIDSAGSTRLLAAVTDITSIKASERAVVAAAEARTIFYSSASHGLRSPLNAILGFAQMLEMDGDDTVRGHAERIQHAGWRLLHLIDNMLAFAGTDSLGGAFAPIAATEIVQQARYRSQHELGTRPVEIGECDDRVVVGDAGLLAGVLATFSAALAVLVPGPNPVALRALRQGGALRIEVGTEGGAFHALELHDMFDPGDRSTAVGRAGLGVSLDAAARTVHAHGGIHGATCEFGRTSLWFELPSQAGAPSAS
jgi:PAS domain S-box-containing protein